MNIRNSTRRLLSIVLAICMMVGFFAVPTRAAKQAEFHYVSVGASNTNGYGMRGYLTEEELNLLLSGQATKDDINSYGYQRAPEGAYPDLIRDYYAQSYETVNLDQLAISSMRVEELRVLLDSTYMGDDYTSWRFTGSGGWFECAEPGGLDALRATYQESISNADLITVDIGWNNFGVYVCNQLVEYLSSGQYMWTTDISNIFPTDAEDQAAAKAKALIGETIESYIGEGELATVLTDICAYSCLGYMYNFDICMEKIHALNPDATVVVLGIQNLLHGVVAEVNGTQIPLGDIFGKVVDMANYYASTRSPYQANYQYVKVGTNEHVTIFLDYMKTYNGDAANLDQNVKDCFDYYDDDLVLQSTIDNVAASLIEEEYGSMLSMIGYDNGLEVVAAGKKGELPTMMGEDLQAIFDSMYWPALYASYDTVAQLVKEIATTPCLDGNGLLSGNLDVGAIEAALADALADEIVENAKAAADGQSYTVDIEKILTDANALVVAAMYARYYMGNSFFAHPSGTGHTEIRDAVLDVIQHPANEKDQALDADLIAMVEKVQQLLCDARGHDYVDGVCSICQAELGVTIKTQPKTGYAKMGETVKVSVKAEGTGLKYQWYIKNANSKKYSKSSVTSATYSAKMTEKVKGRRVYCVITDESGNTVQSKTVLLREAVSIIKQPKTTYAQSGKTAKVSVEASGDGLKY